MPPAPRRRRRPPFPPPPPPPTPSLTISGVPQNTLFDQSLVITITSFPAISSDIPLQYIVDSLDGTTETIGMTVTMTSGTTNPFTLEPPIATGNGILQAVVKNSDGALNRTYGFGSAVTNRIVPVLSMNEIIINNLQAPGPVTVINNEDLTWELTIQYELGHDIIDISPVTATITVTNSHRDTIADGVAISVDGEATVTLTQTQMPNGIDYYGIAIIFSGGLSGMTKYHFVGKPIEANLLNSVNYDPITRSVDLGTTIPYAF